MCQSDGVEQHREGASVEQVTTIGSDLVKWVFQAHGAAASGAVVFRKKLRRDQVLAFFAAQPRRDGGLRRRALLGSRDWGVGT